MELAVVFLPLIGALFSGLFSGSINPKSAQRITVACLCLSALFSALIFYKVAIAGQEIHTHVLTWFSVGSFQANWAIKVDVLTAVMLIVVTWVSAVVHIYSVGYMHDDPHIPRFMSYLSLFTFFMLVLVTADNFVQLFVGWEGVGLCSYLLIGFWYKKASANAAAIKAFVVNRVGDIGLALGIFAIYLVFDSVQYEYVFSAVQAYSEKQFVLGAFSFNVIEVICIFLFIGCMGKSAQLGLHTWLPDAMEGPTPVSALIHAATMVTAGVFLVARCSPLFEYTEYARMIVTIVGASTAIFAATVAVTQFDIKKVIAYSTCSQLGYMFFACGVSAYSAAIFHLATHAFFKALLFLGAGSVIHAMSNEQDIRKMGGIYKELPVTYSLMWIGSLALAGVFPFAGYYSKDIILESAFVGGDVGYIAYWVGLLAAFLTAFYSWRLIFLTFHGQSRASQEVLSHVHESPRVMVYPLYLLAVGSVFAGAFGYYVLDIVGTSGEFWRGAIVALEQNNPLEAAHNVSAWVKFSPMIVGFIGIGLAYIFYLVAPSLPRKCAEILKPVYIFLSKKWYFDELYDLIFVRPIHFIANVAWTVIDVIVIDRFGPNGAADLSNIMAKLVSKSQTGYIYTYALVILFGLLCCLTWYLILYVQF